MKISDAIRILQEIEKEKGDLEILVGHETVDAKEYSKPLIMADYDDESGSEIVIVE